MRWDDSELLLTRRGLLWLAGAGLVWAGGDFWDKKDPADWTADERDKILNKSPWAKEVSAQGAPGQGGYGGSQGGGGYPQGGGGYPQGGGYPGGVGIPGIGGMGRRRGGYPGAGRGEVRKGTVRWESAAPVLAALKTELPKSFANHYVISVNGFPVPGNPEDHIDELKQTSTLQPKDQEIVEAGVVEHNGASGNWLFGFARDFLALKPQDKEVDFATRMGGFQVRAKFNLKEMMYRGQLAV